MEFVVNLKGYAVAFTAFVGVGPTILELVFASPNAKVNPW